MRVGRATWRLFGSVPEVGPRCEEILFYVAIAFFWELYDLSLAMSALGHIAADFNVQKDELAYATSYIRFGALPALLLTSLADVYGRKRVFLTSLAGVSICTCVTALSKNISHFVMCQMACRLFIELCSNTGFVIITEEFPPEHRGWGMGILGATGALGFGLGAVLFAGIEILPWGWRFLYIVGIIPLAVIPLLNKKIPETARFISLKSSPISTQSKQPVLSRYSRRLAGICAACGCFACGNTGVFQFSGYYVMKIKHWEPWQFSCLVISGGAVGVFGNVAVGKYGDKYGRRRTGCILACFFPALAYAFYHSDGAPLGVCWAFLTFLSVAMNVLVRTLSTEIFPTASRGTASGFVSASNAIGGMLGLALVGKGTAHYALPDIICLVSVATIASGVSLLTLPETSGQELEQINELDKDTV